MLDATVVAKNRVEVRGGRIKAAKPAGAPWIEVGTEPVIVGRNAACKVVLDDGKVSAVHAEFVATEEGGKEVQRGVALAHTAGELMNEIVMAAERTAQSGAEISLATAQQQSASDQVVETMREIADVARRTATGSRKVQESAQRLTMIANRLHGLSSSDNSL